VHEIMHADHGREMLVIHAGTNRRLHAQEADSDWVMLTK
jgi:hypothetical protein